MAGLNDINKFNGWGAYFRMVTVHTKTSSNPHSWELKLTNRNLQQQLSVDKSEYLHIFWQGNMSWSHNFFISSTDKSLWIASTSIKLSFCQHERPVTNASYLQWEIHLLSVNTSDNIVEDMANTNAVYYWNNDACVLFNKVIRQKHWNITKHHRGQITRGYTLQT